MVRTEQTSTPDPWATRHEDGTITLHWPEGLAYAPCSRELIEGMVEHHNRLMPLLIEALDGWQYQGDGPDSDRIAEIRRAIGHQA